MTAKKGERDDIAALGRVLDALEGLDAAGQEWVIRLASERLHLPGGGTGSTGSSQGTQGSRTAGQGTVPTPQEFMAQKSPGNDLQRIACLAYYLTHHRGIQNFKAKEITDLNADAHGIELNARYTLANAVAAHYLAKAGGGKKRITSVGERLVEALPDQEAVNTLLKQGRSVRRKKAGTRKKAAKKS